MGKLEGRDLIKIFILNEGAHNKAIKNMLTALDLQQVARLLWRHYIP